MNLMEFVVAALIVEALWETSKMFVVNGNKLNVDRIGAVAFGELIAITGKMDFLAAVGVNLKVPLVGTLLTGLLLSRGANFMHDIVSGIGNLYQSSKKNDTTVIK